MQDDCGRAALLLPWTMPKKHANPLLAFRFAALLLPGVLAACAPPYNWRDYHSAEAHYSVLFPAKPDSFTRKIDLDGKPVSMTMTAAEVDGITFAVGSAEMADAGQAAAALVAMKTALIRNIGGTTKTEQTASTSSVSGRSSSTQASIRIEASGKQNGMPVLLSGRFIAREKRIYQVIVLGEEKRLVRDNTETFIDSFKVN